MGKIFKAFHYVSFLQYPFLLVALYYCYEPLIKGIKTFSKESLIGNYNLALLCLGVAFSFTSLADTSKRTKLTDLIYKKEKRTKNWLIYVCSLIILIFSLAIICQFFINDDLFKNLSIGLFVFGLGMLSILKMNLEIIKTYQKDWENHAVPKP